MDGKNFQSHFQRDGSASCYRERHAGLLLWRNWAHMSIKKWRKSASKGYKKLQKCNKMVTNCEKINNWAGYTNEMGFQENKFVENDRRFGVEIFRKM